VVLDERIVAMSRAVRVAAIVGVLTVGIAIGAFLTASPTANGASRSKLVYLRFGDIAIFGGVQCIANSEAQAKHLLCQRRPRATARYEVAVYPRTIQIYKIGNPDAIYAAAG